MLFVRELGSVFLGVSVCLYVYRCTVYMTVGFVAADLVRILMPRALEFARILEL